MDQGAEIRHHHSSWRTPQPDQQVGIKNAEVEHAAAIDRWVACTSFK